MVIQHDRKVAYELCGRVHAPVSVFEGKGKEADQDNASKKGRVGNTTTWQQSRSKKWSRFPQTKVTKHRCTKKLLPIFHNESCHIQIYALALIIILFMSHHHVYHHPRLPHCRCIHPSVCFAHNNHLLLFICCFSSHHFSHLPRLSPRLHVNMCRSFQSKAWQAFEQ